MPVTSVDISDELMAQALACMPPDATKAATIRAALEILVRIRRQHDGLHWLAESDILGDLRDPAVRAGARR